MSPAEPAPRPSAPPPRGGFRRVLRRAPLLALPLCGLGLALQSYRALRAYRAEMACFRPHRAVVPLPDELGGAPAPRPITFPTTDGTTVAGWYLPSRNRAAVVLAHGSGGDRRSVWPEARALAAAGYGALLFDFPGHGESSGVVRWGRGEQAAMTAAVDTLARQPEVDPAKLGVFGFSMGGHVAAQVAAKDARLRAVVLAGAPSDAELQTRNEYRRDGRLAVAVALWAVRKSGMDMAFERPVDVVGAIAPRRLLVIGGAADWIVVPEMTRSIYDAAREPKAMWLIEGADHGGFAKAAPEEYPRRIKAFFDEGLAPLAEGAAPAAPR